MTVIPFYGTSNPELFAIERAAMDRSGHVLRALDRLLPNAGRVLDVWAGDGFTAEKLTTADRVIVPMEPAMSMMQQTRHLSWVCGEAEALPFSSGAFSGLYATWAYFFPSAHSIELGVREAERVVAPGGPIAIVNNLGDDEFCSLAPRDISESVASFDRLGFTVEVVETHFEFDTLEEAQALLGFYFGDAGRAGAKLSVGYRVGVFHRRPAPPVLEQPTGEARLRTLEEQVLPEVHELSHANDVRELQPVLQNGRRCVPGYAVSGCRERQLGGCVDRDGLTRWSVGTWLASNAPWLPTFRRHAAVLDRMQLPIRGGAPTGHGCEPLTSVDRRLFVR